MQIPVFDTDGSNLGDIDLQYAKDHVIYLAKIIDENKIAVEIWQTHMDRLQNAIFLHENKTDEFH